MVAVALVSGTRGRRVRGLGPRAHAAAEVTLGNEEVLEGVPDVGAIEGGVNLLRHRQRQPRRARATAFGDPDEETAVLNDVTMLMHIAEDHSHASVISFPRDMLVDVPACTDPNDPARPLYEHYDVKINSVLSYGGMPCVVKTVEQLTGVIIPFAGIVQFLGVAGLSEAVGGVEVCVAEPIEDEYTGTFLDAGTHTLSGMAALQFLRTRHGVGDGSDLGRISNQQVFLCRSPASCRASGTFSDPVKLYSHRQGRTGEHAALRQPHGPDAHDLDREGAERHRPRQDRVRPVPDRLRRRARRGRAHRLGRDRERRRCRRTCPSSFDTAAQTRLDFASATDPNAAPAEPSCRAEEVPRSRRRPGRPAPTVEALPSDVTGQTAAETRCSAGRTLDDQ